jgi:hypothetical protein
MNQPTPMTRFVGKPRVAAVLYVGLGLAVLGWAEGAVPWWLGVAALCTAGSVRKAVQDVRSYKQWWTAWAAMGAAGAPPRPATSKLDARGRKASSSWAGVIVAAVALVMIPVWMAAPGASEALRQGLTAVWCCTAVYLLWKLAARLRRARFTAAGTASAGERKNSAAADVVEWALPGASSSPSRADAMRNLPEYSARLIGK